MLQSRPERKRRQLPLQVLAVATQGDPEILKMTRGRSDPPFPWLSKMDMVVQAVIPIFFPIHEASIIGHNSIHYHLIQ